MQRGLVAVGVVVVVVVREQVVNLRSQSLKGFIVKEGFVVVRNIVLEIRIEHAGLFKTFLHLEDDGIIARQGLDGLAAAAAPAAIGLCEGHTAAAGPAQRRNQPKRREGAAVFHRSGSGCCSSCECCRFAVFVVDSGEHAKRESVRD